MDKVEQNQTETATKEVHGWKDIVLHPDLPVSVLIDFLNNLNQRVVKIEDVIQTQDEKGNHISLTEFYKRQIEEEINKQKK